MEYKYKKALEEYDLSVSELPEDAQEGIDQITQIEKAINMQRKKGNDRISDKTMRKIKALDKWVYYEILDHLNDTDKNDDEMPTDADEIKSELNKDNKTQEPVDPRGVKIDEEFTALYSAKKTKLSPEELESSAPTAYDVLFETYNDEDSENGIETSYFRLIETSEDEFTLTKK